MGIIDWIKQKTRRDVREVSGPPESVIEIPKSTVRTARLCRMVNNE